MVYDRNRSLAVEIGLWNSRVNASFSYYNNYTDELLLDHNMAPSTGFATKTMNVGAVETRDMIFIKCDAYSGLRETDSMECFNEWFA